MSTHRKQTVNKEDSKIAGLNVFFDQKGRPVYRHPITKTGYVLSGKTKTFRTLSSRFIIGLIAGLLCILFNAPWYVCVIVGVVVALVVEFQFHRFLKRLPQIQNFKPAEKPSRSDAEALAQRPKIVLKLILLLVLPVLIVLNAYQSNYEQWLIIVNWGLAGLALIMALFEVKALVKNLQSTKK